MRKVYFNGTFVDEMDAKISIYDSALMFGDMVFEMTRSFNKEQFKLTEHLERLYASMKYIRIPEPMSISEMKNAVLETVHLNRDSFEEYDEDRVMINVTRGLIPLYEGKVGVQSGANVIIANYPLRWTIQNVSHLYESGINLVLVPQQAIPAYLLEPKIKNRSRLHYQIANIQASQYTGKDNWAIMLDPDGFIAECTGSNVFIVKDGVVITPEGRNVLRGVSRQYVLDICKQNNISFSERNIDVYDLTTADECFVTATPFCILPAMRFNGQNIGNGNYGEMTKRLLSIWSANVNINIEEQTKLYGSLNKETNAASPYQLKFK